ncbi:sel1 repeat family protein [Cereibacter sphaeroides]|nr:sel1 repeat family protein [Cereibacter sphaeroides]
MFIAKSLPVLALLLSMGGLTPASAQLVAEPAPENMADPVAAARQMFVNGDHAQALTILRPLAEAGDASAQNIVGAAYENGYGVNMDFHQAQLWFERAAQHGNRLAMMNLGRIYRDGGPGFPVDGARARVWLRRSADAGYGPAMGALGRMFEYGVGGPVDLEQARTFYENGRSAGDEWSSEYLAHLYRLGSGVPEDLARARALFAEAAAAGLSQSMGNLGRMMEQGSGGAQDIDGAEALYRRAHGEGHLMSTYNLAWLLYENRHTAEAAAEVRALCADLLPRAEPERHSDWFAECARMQKTMLGY